MSAYHHHRRSALTRVCAGDGARYARGRELVQAGWSERLLLINATASERDDALRNVNQAEVLFDDLPINSWQEAQAVKDKILGEQT
jgi:hypothetical protein